MAYINTLLQYYNISPNPDQLTDWEWASKYAILEDIRKKEKERTQHQLNELAGNHIQD